MGDHHQYGGLPVLRHVLAAGTTGFHGNPQNPEPFFSESRNLAPPPPTQIHHFESIMNSNVVDHQVMIPSGFVKPGVGGGHQHRDQYCSSSTSGGGGGCFYGVEMENSGWINNNGSFEGANNNCNSSRWPRQETLTLLEIRSRLDSRFKEANQKGPLWDEISRIMAEEHGYQRSGKKCREKFENLYKYYKKTKEGKAGRQDGKHYRFFRQLEALYGSETQTPNTNVLQTSSASESHFVNNPLLHYQTSGTNAINQESKHSESLSFSNTSELETSSSENNDEDLSAIAYMMNRSILEKQKGVSQEERPQSHKKVKSRWKSKVRDFVDSRMRKLMETQEAWMERMLKTIEDREHERISREEEWKKQETARFDQEHEFWTKERAWMEARDAALMETLKKYAGRAKGEGELSSAIQQIAITTQSYKKNNKDSNIKNILNDIEMNNIRWTEPEILSLVQLKTTTEQRFQESGSSKEGIWEEVAAKMANLGYERSGEEYQEKWENMNMYLNMMNTESHKKRREDLRTNNYFTQQIENMNASSSSSPSHHTSYMGSCHPIQDSFFQAAVNDQGEHLWNNFGLNLSNDKNQQL